MRFLKHIAIAAIAALPLAHPAAADTLDKILGQTGAGQRFDGLKAINISLAASAWIPAPAERYKQWQTQYPYNERTPATNVLCGPNAGDDNDPGAATQPCYPGNLDAYRKDFAQLAQAMVPVIRLATDKKVILVKAASNSEGVIKLEACRALGKVGRPEDATVLV